MGGGGVYRLTSFKILLSYFTCLEEILLCAAWSFFANSSVAWSALVILFAVQSTAAGRHSTVAMQRCVTSNNNVRKTFICNALATLSQRCSANESATHQKRFQCNLYATYSNVALWSLMQRCDSGTKKRQKNFHMQLAGNVPATLHTTCLRRFRNVPVPTGMCHCTGASTTCQKIKCNVIAKV